jgi:hypothetical protein
MVSWGKACNQGIDHDVEALKKQRRRNEAPALMRSI